MASRNNNGPEIDWGAVVLIALIFCVVGLPVICLTIIEIVKAANGVK